MRFYCIILTWILLGLTSQWSAAADGQLTHVDVFVSETEGYHTFRIPSVERTAGGTLHAFAEGRLTNRSDPGGTHIDLVYKRSTDGGKSWSALVSLDRHPDTNVDNLEKDLPRQRTPWRLWIELMTVCGCSIRGLWTAIWAVFKPDCCTATTAGSPGHDPNASEYRGMSFTAHPTSIQTWEAGYR